MIGLFMYYVTLLRKKYFFYIAVGIMVLLIGFTESVYEISILYLMLIPSFVFTSNKDEYNKNVMFEKLLPIKQSKIVLFKYIVFLSSILAFLVISCVYLVTINEFSSTKIGSYTGTSLVIDMLGIGISIGTCVLMLSCMKKKSWGKYIVFFFMFLQLIEFFPSIKLDDFINTLAKGLTSYDYKHMLISSTLFFLVSYPIAVYFQKNKTL